MTGQERVVHRYLLMLVNFLPVDVDSVSDQTFLSSCENVSVHVIDVDEVMSVVEAGDAGSRTREGVGNLTSVCVDNHARDCSTGDVLNMGDEPRHASSSHPLSKTEMSSEHGCTHVPSTDTQSVHTRFTHSLLSVSAPSMKTPSIQSDSSNIHRVRTLVGRVVMPVNRLLHQMYKQGVVSDAGQLVDKVSKSLCSVFQ